MVSDKTTEEPLGFEPIWNVLKMWDISRDGTSYHGPTGDDVRFILRAIEAAGLEIRRA